MNKQQQKKDKRYYRTIQTIASFAVAPIIVSLKASQVPMIPASVIATGAFTLAVCACDYAPVLGRRQLSTGNIVGMYVAVGAGNLFTFAPHERRPRNIIFMDGTRGAALSKKVVTHISGTLRHIQTTIKEYRYEKHNSSIIPRECCCNGT